VLAGFTAQKTKLDNQQAVGLNYLSDNITTLNTALSIDQPNTFNTTTKTGLLSYLARVSYSFADRYLLSASYRTDGSSYFGPGHKWGSFPGISAGWVTSKEKFMTKIGWINNLKFRGSYGATGNNRINDFAFVDLLYQGNYPLGSGNGIVAQGVVPSSTTIANPLITWERTFQFNGGMDLTMFNNRISLSLDVYHQEQRHYY